MGFNLVCKNIYKRRCPLIQQIQGDTLTNKLIMLFVFDKMEIPLSGMNITDICCASNNWIAYMDCAQILRELVDAEFIYEMKERDDKVYKITTLGRNCLKQFYTKIHASIRQEISMFAKDNRLRYRRKQEYVADYFKNEDDTYTVVAEIRETKQTALSIRLAVPDRKTAKNIYKDWENKAAEVYMLLYEKMIDQ